MRVKKLGGGRLEITRNGGKPLLVGVIRVRGGGQKAQPLSGKSTELGEMSGSGRRKMWENGGEDGMRAENRYLWGF